MASPPTKTGDLSRSLLAFFRQMARLVSGSSIPLHPLSRQHVQLHQAFVDVLLDDADVYQRFPLEGMAENPLQGNHVAGHFVVPVAEGFPQGVAADPVFNARLFGNAVHDLVNALARDGAWFMGEGIALAGLENIFVPPPAREQPVDFPPCAGID